MVLPGHLSGGYLAARAVLFLTHASFSPTQAATLLVIGTLAGEAPDIDLLFFYFNQRSKASKKVAEHRGYFTHTPLVWLVLSLAIVTTGRIFDSSFVQSIGWMILAGTFCHFILDSLEHGIRWLWPFSNKRRALLNTDPDIEYARIERDNAAVSKGTFKSYWRFVTGPYLKSWTVWLEILITLAALWALCQ